MQERSHEFKKTSLEQPVVKPLAERIREWEGYENPEKTAEYRRFQNQAAKLARRYDGTEASEMYLMNQLIAWEDWMKEQLPEETNPLKREESLAKLYNPHLSQTVQDYLTVAQRSADTRALESLHAKEATEKAFQSVYVEDAENYFLPPQEMPRSIGEPSENSKEWEVRFDEIFLELTALLKAQDIFLDDLLVTKGKEPNVEMMRQESYLKVEIPRIRKTVLLNPQVGEATFVIQGYIPNELLDKWTKEDLLANELYPAKRVIRGANWASEVSAYLFEEESWDRPMKQSKRKINVREIAEYRRESAEALRAEYSAQEWLKMSSKERKKITVSLDKGRELGLKGLASIFEAQDEEGKFSYGRVIDQLRLGTKIWLESREMQEAYERESNPIPFIKEILTEEAIGVEEWLKMSVTKRSRIIISLYKGRDLGLTGLASIFEAQDEEGKFSYGRAIDHLRLGTKIWPESREMQEAYERESNPIPFIKEILTEEAIGVDEWLNMSFDERNKITISLYKGRELGLKALASIFEARDEEEKFFQGRVIDHLRLGTKIWPESREMQEAYERESNPLPFIKEILNEEAIGAEEWLNMSLRERNKITISLYKGRELGLKGLASIFEAQDEEGKFFKGLTIDQLRLGTKIWPESREMQEAYERESNPIPFIKEILTEEAIGVEEWLKMSVTKRSRIIISLYKGRDLGLTGLASIFEAQDEEGKFSYGRVIDQLRLGIKIWPESREMQEAYERESNPLPFIKEILNEEAIGAEEWLKMSTKKRMNITISLYKGRKLGLTALASIFEARDEEGSFSEGRAIDQLRLGTKIWPESREMQEAYERESNPVPFIKEILKEEAIGADEWLNMSLRERKKITISLYKGRKLGLTALALIFEAQDEEEKFFKGRVIDHLRLGIKIWPESREMQEAYERELNPIPFIKEILTEEAIGAEEWLNMSFRKRNRITISLYKGRKLGLAALASIFEAQDEEGKFFKGRVIDHLRLGIKIWPESREMEEAYEREQKGRV